MENIISDMQSQSIKSPEGVALLMENLWFRHRAGMKQRPNNVFMVGLPPLTEDELWMARKTDLLYYNQKELFGGFV